VHTVRRCVALLLLALAASATSAHAAFIDIGAGLTGVQDGCGTWGDFDGDGDLDLAIVGNSVAGPSGRVYRNTGGTFTPGPSLPPMTSGAVAWGDYDRDGDLDLALTGAMGSIAVTYVLENTGADTLVIAATLEGLTESAVAWGDYDADGDVDLAVAGWNGTAAITHLYRNDGHAVFVDAGAGLTGLRRATVAWCDEDQDGDLDLLVTGATTTGAVTTQLYSNDGAAGFRAITTLFLGAKSAAIAWADWDLDGDPDVLVDGQGAMAPSGRVYRNAGGHVFVDAALSLQSMVQCSAMWGDADADGDPDLLMAGSSGSVGLSILYTNNAGAMTNSSAGLPGVWNSSVAWGDYDDDGRLDLFLAGVPFPGGTPFARIYHNVSTPTNTPPSPPSGLDIAIMADSLRFQWTAASDAQTPAPTLGYNLWVGSTATSVDIVAPMAVLSTGHRRVAAPGNVGQRLSWKLARRGLPNTLSWGVQAIDASYAGSAFATRTQTLAVGGPAAPGRAGLRVVGPNPFRGHVRLACELDREADVRVTVADVGGRTVRTLAAGAWPAGARELRWDGTRDDGRAAAAGVYFVRLDAGQASRTLRLLRLR